MRRAPIGCLARRTSLPGVLFSPAGPLLVVLAAVAAPEGADDPAAGSAPALGGNIELTPRGIFIVNTGYNTGTLTPGSFVFYAAPPAVSRSQFYISPANTVIGFGIAGLSYRGAAISGGLDVTLRSPTPLLTANTISPQFYDVHIQIETGRLRVVLGQYPDVLLPFIPDTVNSLPSGYVPGAIGYVRPQIRGDVRLPFGERAQFIMKAALAQPIQTFQLGADEVGRQGGVPDLQARASLAVGRSPRPWERPFEVGLGGHLGRRRLTNAQDNTTRAYRSWSIAADLRLTAPTGTGLKLRWWRGSLLGDYAAGVFQTIDLGTGLAVHAQGFWLDVQQRLGQRWRVAAGYGRDDPRDADLSPGARALNQAGFANALWNVSATLAFGAEVSRWATSYLGAGTTRVSRGDLIFMLRF
jgi:hypothetical protein